MIRHAFALCATLFLFAPHAEAANRCVTYANANALASDIAAGVNAARRAQGQPALRYNARLGQAAMKHACDMSVNNFFGHQGSDRSTVQARVRQSGYRDCLVAENLAWGYPASQQIMTGWMNSAGHRNNILHPRVAEMGIAITDGPKGPNWVLVLARSC